MKIRCEIIAVETTGDGLRVKMQGKPPSAALWRPEERQEVVVPATKMSQRALHVGRTVEIIIRPR